MWKQKTDCHTPIYGKLALALVDIRYKFKNLTNLLLLLILVYKTNIIFKNINIIEKLAKQLEFINEMINNKIIFIKKSLMLV